MSSSIAHRHLCDANCTSAVVEDVIADCRSRNNELELVGIVLINAASNATWQGVVAFDLTDASIDIDSVIRDNVDRAAALDDGAQLVLSHSVPKMEYDQLICKQVDRSRAATLTRSTCSTCSVLPCSDLVYLPSLRRRYAIGSRIDTPASAPVAAAHATVAVAVANPANDHYDQQVVACRSRGKELVAILCIHASGTMSWQGISDVRYTQAVINFTLADFEPDADELVLLRSGGEIRRNIEATPAQYQKIVCNQVDRSTAKAERRFKCGCQSTPWPIIMVPSTHKSHPCTGSWTFEEIVSGTPPDAPLVGIELNPGPSRRKSATVRPSPAAPSAGRALYHRLANGKFVLVDSSTVSPLAIIVEEEEEDDSEDGLSVSMHASMTTSMSVTAGTAAKVSAYKKIRKVYETLLEKHDKSRWKDVFKKVAATFAAEREAAQPSAKKQVVASAAGVVAVVHDFSDQTISFAASTNHSKIVTFNRTTHPVIFVGRLSICDVQMSKDDRTSRIQFVVMCNPGKKILIVDVGSLGGWDVESRSRPGAFRLGYQVNSGRTRSIIECDTDEAVTIRWRRNDVAGVSIASHNYLQINPLVCIVCMDAVRSIKYKDCGHLVLCSACNTKQYGSRDRTCELCRTPVEADLITGDDHGCLTHA